MSDTMNKITRDEVRTEMRGALLHLHTLEAAFAGNAWHRDAHDPVGALVDIDDARVALLHAGHKYGFNEVDLSRARD